MSFYDLAKNRFSVRKFKTSPIPQEKIDKILLCGNIAPTGCNLQPQKIYVLNSEDALNKLKNCTRCHFDAPCAMLVCYDKNQCWTRKYDGSQSGIIDASIVTTHMMLGAYEEGIGTCWVMHFDPFKMREAFSIPQSIEPVALLVMGEPADDATPLDMHEAVKPIGETVEYL